MNLSDDLKKLSHITNQDVLSQKYEHIVRLHIGLEDPSDLIADIKQALKHLK